MELQVDGKPAFVATQGHALDPTRPSILFVHGVGLDHSIWTLPMRYFARHGRNVLAVDLPGHGRSVGPALAKIEALGEWLIRLLDAATIRQSALVGYSMGSLVTLAAAALHPERLRALALLGPAAPMPVHERLSAAAGANDHAAIDMLNIWAHTGNAQLGGLGAPGLWKLGAAARLWELTAPGVIHADLKACAEYTDGQTHATRINCPTLLILGDRDIMTPPAAGKQLSAAIPGARVVSIPNCGHAMLDEQPNAVLDALIKIL